MNKIKAIIFFCICMIMCACGIDVTDPQAGYFDDHTDKSGTQNFNNNGSGSMEVNINYNNDSPSTTIIPTRQTVNTTAQNYIIAGISFELIDKYLYGTNISNNEISCTISYRGNTPKTTYMGNFGWKPQEVEDAYIGNNIKNNCIIITAVICNDENYSSKTYMKEISNWSGYSELCES